MLRVISGAGVRAMAGLFVAGAVTAPLWAQTPAMDDLRGKIFDAKMAQQIFAGGLHHCSELNGKNFYFQPRDRVLDLEEYHQSLENLALQGVFNPATKRPWNQKDADARWAQVQDEARKDQANCALVASLPDLEKQLLALQQAAKAGQSAAPPTPKPNPSTTK